MSYIRKLSNGKYRAEIRKNQTTIKNKTFIEKSEAELWANDFECKIEKILSIKTKKLKKLSPDKVEELGGADLFNKLGVDVNFALFKDVLNSYIKDWKGKDESMTARALFWLTIFADTPIKSIKPSHIEKILDQYAIGSVQGMGRDKPKGNNTLLRMKSVLSSIFIYAIDKKILEKNPTLQVKIKAEKNQIERFLSDEERGRLLEACKQSSWDKMHLLIMLAITTGMRKSELSGLRWNDINFDKGLATLHDTKNGSPRLNPIPSFVLEEMKQFRQVGNGLIFYSPNDMDRPFDFRKQWEKMRRDAKIEDFRFHDLRHSAASYLVMDGATLYETGQILGHKSQETTQRYAHLSTNHKAALSERVMNKVFSV